MKFDENNYIMKEFRKEKSKIFGAAENQPSLVISTLNVPDKTFGITRNTVVVSTRLACVPGAQGNAYLSCSPRDLWFPWLIYQRKRAFYSLMSLP